MDFYQVSPDKLKVSLSAQDLLELGITYDSLDYTDPVAKELLIALLEKGKQDTGFSPRRARLFIEVFPSEEGGCIITYTCLRTGQNPPGLRDSTGPAPVVFAFFDVETMLDAAVKTYARYGHRIYKSSLYQLEYQWRLIVYPLDYADHMSVLFLGEFAEKVGAGNILAAFVEEHGKLLIADTALDTLSSYFS